MTYAEGRYNRRSRPTGVLRGARVRSRVRAGSGRVRDGRDCTWATISPPITPFDFLHLSTRASGGGVREVLNFFLISPPTPRRTASSRRAGPSRSLRESPVIPAPIPSDPSRFYATPAPTTGAATSHDRAFPRNPRPLRAPAHSTIRSLPLAPRGRPSPGYFPHKRSPCRLRPLPPGRSSIDSATHARPGRVRYSNIAKICRARAARCSPWRCRCRGWRQCGHDAINVGEHFLEARMY